MVERGMGGSLLMSVDRCYMSGYVASGIPVPVEVDPAQPEAHVPPDFIEPSMGLVVVPEDLPVRAVAEGSVCRHLALAQLIVPTFIHVEGHRTAAGHGKVAGTVTNRA